jgi:hypothetical protein
MKLLLFSFLLLVSSTGYSQTRQDSATHHSRHFRHGQNQAYYVKAVTGDTITLSAQTVTINDSTGNIKKIYIAFPSDYYNNEWRSLFIYPHIDTIKFINCRLDAPITHANKLTWRRFQYLSSDSTWHWYKPHPMYYKGQ